MPEPTGPVRVVVVDDQEGFRAAARLVLRAASGFELVGEAGSGADALSLAVRTRPDLVVMDVHLPDIDGIEATRRILGRLPATAVLLVSAYAHNELPADAEHCGALGFLGKEDLTPARVASVWQRARG